MGLKLTPRVQPSDNTFIDRLIKSESGGNPNASITIKDGRTFAGLGQFGTARLKDLGMGETFTYDQYLKNENNLQRTILDRHIADIDRQIERDNLGQYEGKTIGGVPINRQSMYAMAHLGGYGGMKKFIESGGTSNPSDELGTSLRDYGIKFGGPTMAAAEATKPTSLGSFAESARNNADKYERTAIEGSMLARNMNAQAMMYGPQPTSPLGFADRGNQPPTMLPNGQPMLPNLTPFSAGGTESTMSTQSMPSDTAPAGTPDLTAATEEELGIKAPLLDRIANFLAPNAENPRNKVGDILGALGVGFGQMSHGQPVNLQPYFAGLNYPKVNFHQRSGVEK